MLVVAIDDAIQYLHLDSLPSILIVDVPMFRNELQN